MVIAWFSKDAPTNLPKPFKFFNFWTLHPTFWSVVKQSWHPTIFGNSMLILFLKLKRLKTSLKSFNNSCFSEISNRVKSKRIELEQQQMLSLKGTNPIDKELQIQKDLFMLEEAELMFLKQKAKIQWIKEGDKCSKFFHSAVAVKNKKETIRMLINDQGLRLESFDDMASEVIAFYKNLIGSVDTNVKGCDYNFLKNILSYSLPPEHSSNLIKDVTTEEIKEAIFEQGNDKAPGPDGYTPLFFKKTWSIVGEDVVRAIKHLTLFIGVFLSDVLKALDIPQRFIDWIEACFKQARFSISFNGSLIGYFKGARGIRQGDPLSPILFVLSMNILSSMLNMASTRGLFNYHPKCKKVGITHLSFADDLLIFCKGNVELVIGVITVLESFYEMSGLNLNAAKCMFFTAGISLSHIEHIKQATGFTYGHLPVRYLGVPLITRKLSENDCESLIASIKARLALWSGKNLSYAGRLELVRAVLFSIANYWCRQLPLPQAIISKIEQLCSRFFWKGSDKSATGARKSVANGKQSQFQLEFQSYPQITQCSTTPIRMGILYKDIWQEIRVKEIKVPWHSLIWFPQHIPKHSLIAWMAILDRLPT
ncbi:uncharacterized protein LOC120137444 [Hibiscus syriacus]|uniref:uncharacterized protein LOC120137444 n=1 Tax=Hibiscus syriacus TaxID=106335 RepID=UPI001924C6C6|nr:uncharacterized protein LOC120137444 [Hibiscus syriacus]